MRILLLGASGLIGRPLYHCLAAAHTVYGSYCSNIPSDIPSEKVFRLEVGQPALLLAQLQALCPDVVISALRGDFPQQITLHQTLADHLQGSGGRCIFLSTANVLDGDPSRAHDETDHPCPASDYGKYKVACEELLQAALPGQYLIARLPHVFSGARARQLLHTIVEGEPLVENLYMSCNTVENLAPALLHYVDTGCTGVVHLTSTDEMPQAQVFRLLAQALGVQLHPKAENFTRDSFFTALGCNPQTSSEDTLEGISTFHISLCSTGALVPPEYQKSIAAHVAALDGAPAIEWDGRD